MPPKIDNTTQAFFALLRAGLWEQDVRLGTFIFSKVYRLASQQAVVGTVAAGLEYVVDMKVPKEGVMPFMTSALSLEQRNLAMNAFIAELFQKLENEGIKALLVKGQGIAQCYSRPLWRACGDVDLFLDEANYHKAKEVLSSIAQRVEEEVVDKLHLSMMISGWEVELHGTLRPDLGIHIDRMVDLLQKDTFDERKVRVWDNGNTAIPLPAPDNDVIFVFTHILQHFFRGGIGLRQICDWCRLLWTYRNEIDKVLLESRLRKMGFMPEWQTFASLAVGTLGMPEEAMPLYNSGAKWKRKANKVLSIILETGNFGHNKDLSYYDRHSRLGAKVISVWKHTEDSLRAFALSPKHALISWWRMLVWGAKRAMVGK